MESVKRCEYCGHLYIDECTEECERKRADAIRKNAERQLKLCELEGRNPYICHRTRECKYGCIYYKENRGNNKTFLPSCFYEARAGKVRCDKKEMELTGGWPVACSKFEPRKKSKNEQQGKR